MNYRMIRYTVSLVLKIEAALMLLPALVAAIYTERQGFVYVITGLICLAAGFLISLRKPEDTQIHARDGFATCALCWIVMSLFGCLPFIITKEIPSFTDALFETASGFTTTGASILTDVESLSHASLFWRSFTHFIGGMGVLVLLLALLPMRGGSSMNLMKAESPGPSVTKFVPKVRESAKILYLIYIGLTVLTFIALLIARMKPFDAICLSVGAAGTGGFAVLNSGCFDYTTAQQWILTVSMIFFGTNFSFWYLLISRKPKAAFKLREVWVYYGIIVVATTVIMLNVSGFHPTGRHLSEAAFQVGALITTTGFSTADFNNWPGFSKTLLVLLMFSGACAGSTGGGVKVSRLMILVKSIKNELSRLVHPRIARRIRLDGKEVEQDVVNSTFVYFAAYLAVFIVSLIIVSGNEFSFTTNVTSVLATLNNIGPGLEMIGPTGNYAAFSVLSKLVLTFDMIAGRLEIIPMLVLFNPGTWKR